MVEVAAAQDVIACLVFFLHVFGKHRDLSLADRIAVAVSGHVEFEDHQLFSVYPPELWRCCSSGPDQRTY